VASRVVLSGDAAIPRLRRALVAPWTTTIRGLASEVVLEAGDDPVPRRCTANLDSVESVAIGVLVDVSVGLLTCGCGRSVRRSRLRSTVSSRVVSPARVGFLAPGFRVAAAATR
jgi:hypothetical protein